VRRSKNSLENPRVHTNLANTPKQTRWIASSFIRASTTVPNRVEPAYARNPPFEGIAEFVKDHVAFEYRNFPSSACQIGIYECTRRFNYANSAYARSRDSSNEHRDAIAMLLDFKVVSENLIILTIILADNTLPRLHTFAGKSRCVPLIAPLT